MSKSIPFKHLEKSNLVIDRIYEGGKDVRLGQGNDPISKILQCSNQGGFRYRGSTKTLNFQYIILTSSQTEIDWPDTIDYERGILTYYGDNRSSGHELHETRKKGNMILKHIFDLFHKGLRDSVPPVFLFTKLPYVRDYEFRGLAVPGASSLSAVDDLVAVWGMKDGKRFQNYKAVLTILDVPKVSRDWINDLKQGKIMTNNCPENWKKWVRSGKYTPLTAEKFKRYRTKDEQIPSNKISKKLITLIYNYYKNKPTEFERCAAEIVRLMDRNVTKYDLTQASVDGGRDAIGTYSIGLPNNSIVVDFSIEAKCYSLGNPVGVKEMSRLISRIRPRQFGVMVTTSYVGLQAYQEIIEDRHPIIIVAAIDIVEILRNAGYDTPNKIEKWLKSL